MNTKKIIVLSGLMVFLLTLSGFKTIDPINNTINSSIDQEGLIVYATYNGHADSVYNFVVKDRNGKEQALAFQKVDAAILTAFDLNAETFVGTMFKVTFNQGDDDTKTISKLEKLQNY